MTLQEYTLQLEVKITGPDDVEPRFDILTFHIDAKSHTSAAERLQSEIARGIGLRNGPADPPCHPGAACAKEPVTPRPGPGPALTAPMRLVSGAIHRSMFDDDSQTLRFACAGTRVVMQCEGVLLELDAMSAATGKSFVLAPEHQDVTVARERAEKAETLALSLGDEVATLTKKLRDARAISEMKTEAIACIRKAVQMYAPEGAP